MGRADHARRERQSRPHAGSAHALASRPRRPAEAASSLSSGFPARLARPGAAAACLLFAGLLLLATAAPALAQTSVKLVGNTGQTSEATAAQINVDLAQAFTTGSDAAGNKGFKLTSVKGKIVGHSSAPIYTAHIFKANTQTGHPTGDSLGTLTNPSLSTTGTVTWTATGGGIDLDAGTGYLFVLDLSAGGSVFFDRTTSNAEDGTPASGWSVDNVYFQRSGTANNLAWGNSPNSEALQIEIHGYAKTAPVRTGFGPTPPVGALVDNYSLQESNSLASPSLTIDPAQGFTTGTAPGGYKLTSVTLALLGSGTFPVLSVEIRTGDTSGNFAIPTNTVVGTLTAPASLSFGANTFTAVGGIDLEPGTTYFVVVNTTGTAENHFWAGRRVAFEQNAVDAGWSIADYGLRRAGATWTQFLNSGQQVVLRLAIHGSVKDALPPDAPGQPTVVSVAGKGGQLAVSWDAPAKVNGAYVIDYDLRYCDQNSDAACAGKWIAEGDLGASGIPDPGATRGTLTSPVIISGLTAATTYRVQVRAANAAGESAWSPTRTRTTAAATSGNAAPVVLTHLTTANSAGHFCDVDTATTPSRGPQNSTAGVQVSAILSNAPEAASVPADCSTRSLANQIFHDANGDALTFTVSATLPANVRSVHDPGDTPYPRVAPTRNGGARLWNRAVAAGTRTNVVATVTAVDEHGASKSVTYTFAVGTFTPAAGAPRLKAPGLLRFAQNTRGSAVLPAATGGDTRISATDYPGLYLYHVSGLPPGLSFDPKTRTVSGTPTTAGTWTATYTADDYDSAYSRKDSATAADKADAATRTFKVRVDPATGAAPTIKLMQVASRPAHSLGSNNVYDTYVLGDEILIDVQYDRPVAASLPRTNSRISLRLDLGDDAGSRSTNRRLANLKSIEYGGRVLRFAYTVQTGASCQTSSRTGDCDPDGIWVQTGGSNQVVFLANDATLVDAETGVTAGRTLTGLPTAGGQLGGAVRAKVDGGTTSANGARVKSAEVDGATLTVTFGGALHGHGQFVNTGVLVTELGVQSAGDVQGYTGLYQHPDTVSFSQSGGATVMYLTLSQPARPGQRVTLDYGGTQLKDHTNRLVPGFQQLEVTNVTGGAASVAPAPVRGSAAGGMVTLVFSRALSEGSAPTAGAFQVWATDRNHDYRSIWGRATATASVQGSAVTIPLEGALSADDTVTVNYFKPASGRLKDRLLHTEVASFRLFPIDSNHDVTPPGAPTMVVVQHPTVTTASTVTLYFSKPLDTGSGSTPNANNFEVRRGGSGGAIVTTASHAVANNGVVFGANSASTSGTTVWHVVYKPDADGGTKIRDKAGNAVAAFTVQVTATSAIKPVPSATGVTVDGATLTVIFGNQNWLDPSSVPAASAFTFHDTETPPAELDIGIDAVSMTAHRLFLHLENPVPPCAGATVTNNIAFRLTYTKPTASGAAKLQGLASSGEVDTFDPALNVKNARANRCTGIR